ncbi:HU family DNA-binding protein [Parabacteroides sp. BX2]|jgi:predicted histone-like DNA-binding protein|uniref:Viral histone-like protein n=1 Tax=Parabacteroides segnis TaxID=2763058 RepID=A0ABR7E728_9BACT|nr:MULTISPECIES: HU family DNA-binding protein [Parabacteroides]MBC5644998.1 HU family DNA-binding protein [Parabacteroides segnis]MCM0712438.1 HU family DNA-binding protein [Parabacteroides sp. TA-V-105]
MCAKYAFYKNPPNRETGETGSLYAKVVSGGKITTDKLADEIAQRSTFSSGDVKGVVKALSEMLHYHLSEGETVDIDGIGNFSVTLKTLKGITDPKQIRAESIRFNNVVYRTSPELKHKLKTIPLVRAVLPKRKDLAEEERLANILSKLKDERLVSSTDCMLFNHCSRYQALKDLKKLNELGKITWLGRGKQKYYVLKERWQKGMRNEEDGKE